MKKYLAFLLALLLTAAMLTGCGASKGPMENAAADQYYPEAPMEMEDSKSEAGLPGAAAGATGSVSDPNQKMIRKVNISAETEDLEALLSELSGQVAGLGGYIENQEIHNGGAYSGYRYRSASLTVRIPAEALSGFVGQVRGLANVVSYNESAEDVTLTYVSTESRVAALEAEEARLLELMEKAENMTDLLVIEERLTEVRTQLEITASQLRVLANQVNYATVYLYLDQVEVYTEVEPLTVWQRMGSGFRENLRDMGERFTDFCVWAVTYSPQLLLWGIGLTLGIILARRKIRLPRRKKKEPKQPEE